METSDAPRVETAAGEEIDRYVERAESAGRGGRCPVPPW
jgi:hypothetical protein